MHVRMITSDSCRPQIRDAGLCNNAGRCLSVGACVCVAVHVRVQTRVNLMDGGESGGGTRHLSASCACRKTGACGCCVERHSPRSSPRTCTQIGCPWPDSALTLRDHTAARLVRYRGQRARRPLEVGSIESFIGRRFWAVDTLGEVRRRSTAAMVDAHNQPQRWCHR